MLEGRHILLVISGGIAAYKSLELIRRVREQGAHVRCILTAAACEFITPMSAAALSEERAYTDLFSLTDESEMGHIRLAREAHAVVVAPATANILAKMRCGIADDLATTALLATDKPILVAPAMNVAMWNHEATQDNMAVLAERGVHRVGPGSGDLACGESGDGRMAEPAEIVDAIGVLLGSRSALVGRKALVTSGPTHEPVDPVRYLGNRSSGKQGHAIAAALARAGAETTLVSGPTALADPFNVAVVHVQTAQEMLDACRRALPVDVAVCAAAVADWRIAEVAREKIKKGDSGPPRLELRENPDILASLASTNDRRPLLVIGFAAETEEVEGQAAAKRRRKGCDWILANDVSASRGTFGGDHNEVVVIDDSGVEHWPAMHKTQVAERLVARIAEHFDGWTDP